MSDEPIRVLIVEDNETMQVSLQQMISLAKDIVCVGATGDGENSIELARQMQPNVILMDVGLPGIDGIAAGRTILRLLPRTAIILISGERGPEFSWSQQLLGASDYLVKPFTIDDLHGAIRSAAATAS